MGLGLLGYSRLGLGLLGRSKFLLRFLASCSFSEMRVGETLFFGSGDFALTDKVETDSPEGGRFS